MRIAIVINTSWNIYNFRRGLIEDLKSNGHTVFAIAPQDDYSEKISELGVTFVPLNMDSKGTNPFKDIALYFEFRKLYKKLDLDVVLHFTIKPNLYGTLATRKLNICSINNVTGLGTAFIRENWMSKLVSRMYKTAFNYSSHVFFQNGDDLSLFLDKKIISSDLASLLPGSGIKYQDIFYEPKKDISYPLTFFMPSRLLLDKGINEFLGAAKRMKAEFGDDVKFIVCGKPEKNPSIGIDENTMRFYESEGVLEYYGHVDNVLSRMKQSDCVVLPSYREGTPRVLLEASCTGTFIITTDAPGCREVVRHGVNGYLCEVRNTESLFNCMRDFVNLTIEERLKLLDNGRDLVETKFDERIVVDGYLEVIDQAVNGNY